MTCGLQENQLAGLGGGGRGGGGGVHLLFQEMEYKKDFQDDDHDGHLGFPIRWILNIFDLQVAPIIATKF